MSRAYEYYTPSTLTEAINLLNRFGLRGKVIAGGTDVMVAIKKGKISPEALIDISGLKELKEIRAEGGRLIIGAAVTFTSLMNDQLIKQTLPVLSEAASEIGSPLIRNLGTVGGNLGTASPGGDFLTPLVALDAEVRVVGKNGERVLPVDYFLSSGGSRALQSGELIKEINIGLAEWNNPSGAFVKLGRRNALAIARINIALIVNRDTDSRSLNKVALAVGAVGPIPFRVKSAELTILEKYANSDLSLAVIKEVQQEVALSLGNRPSAPYKVKAVRGVVLEVLRKCCLINCVRS